MKRNVINSKNIFHHFFSFVYINSAVNFIEKLNTEDSIA